MSESDNLSTTPPVRFWERREWLEPDWIGSSAVLQLLVIATGQ